LAMAIIINNSTTQTSTTEKSWLGICFIFTDHELCSRTATRHKY
jgi:hypothetical protein